MSETARDVLVTAIDKHLREIVKEPGPEIEDLWPKICGKLADLYLAALAEAGFAVEEGLQPIETAPRDGTRLLMYDPEGGTIASGGISFDPMFFVGYWDTDAWRDDVATVDFRPTHWRALPEPPKP